VFLGAWTDERALFASSLVYLYHVYLRQREGADWRASYFGATPIAVIVVGIAYIVLRFAMAQHYQLAPPSGGLMLVISDASNLPIGCWTALEGGWLLVVPALLILAQTRQFAFLTLYGSAISIVLICAMSVVDITRSMAYAVPAIFIAIAVLKD